jgi:hypothetical protein
MKPIQVLPESYSHCYTLDSRQHKIAQGIILVIGVGAFFLCLQAIRFLFPALADVLKIGRSPFDLIGFFTAVVTFIVLHECIHGLALWFFTGEWPAFGINAISVYVNASRWYLPRLPMLAMSLAPFCSLSILGIFLLSVTSGGLFRMILWAVLLNAIGSVNDLAVAAWVFLQPDTVLMKNSGLALSIYRTSDEQAQRLGVKENMRGFIERHLVKLP